MNGQEVTGAISLEAGTYPVEVTADNCKAYTGNITITADAATHTQTIAMAYLPADYTKVDEAIAKANALSKDDYKDFAAVENAVKAVVRGKNITEQGVVDAMAKAIEDAIAAAGKSPILNPKLLIIFLKPATQATPLCGLLCCLSAAVRLLARALSAEGKSATDN